MKPGIKHKRCPICGKIRPSYLFADHLEQCRKERAKDVARLLQNLKEKQRGEP